MVCLKDMEFTCGQMAVDMKAILNREWEVDMGIGYQGMIRRLIEDHIHWTKKVDMESIVGKIDMFTKAILKMT